MTGGLLVGRRRRTSGAKRLAAPVAAAIVAGVVAAVVLLPARPAFAKPACPGSLGGYPLDADYGSLDPTAAGIVENTDIAGLYSLFCGYGDPYGYDSDRIDYQGIVAVNWSEEPQDESPTIKCGSWFDPAALVTPNDVTPGEEFIEWVVYYDTVNQHYFTGANTLVEVNFKVFDEFPLGTARSLALELFAAAAAEAALCPAGGPNPLGVADPAHGAAPNGDDSSSDAADQPVATPAAGSDDEGLITALVDEVLVDDDNLDAEAAVAAGLVGLVGAGVMAATSVLGSSLSPAQIGAALGRGGSGGVRGLTRSRTTTIYISGDEARRVLDAGPGGDMPIPPDQQWGVYVEAGGATHREDHLGTRGTIRGIGPIVEGGGDISIAVEVDTYFPAAPASSVPVTIPAPAPPAPSGPTTGTGTAPGTVTPAGASASGDAPPVAQPPTAPVGPPPEPAEPAFPPPPAAEPAFPPPPAVEPIAPPPPAAEPAFPPPPPAPPGEAAPRPSATTEPTHPPVEPPPAEEPAAEATASPQAELPGEMTPRRLADRIRQSRAAQLLDRDDIASITNLIEDPKARSIEILPPIGQPVAPDIDLGFGKIDVELTGIANTPDGVRLTLGGIANADIGVRDGRLFVEVPSIFSGYRGTADAYLDRISQTFASTGRRIASIRMNEIGWLEITAERMPSSGG